MRKKLLITLVLLLCVLCSVILTACNRWISVTVYCGNDSYEDKVYKGDPFLDIDMNQFDITRKGYYFTGFWDKEEGGIKYHNAKGRAVDETREWDETYPTTLYGQWKPASGYQSETTKWDKTISFYTHQGSFSDGECINFYLNKEEETLIDGNMDKTIEVTVSGRIMAPADRIELFLQDKKLSGYEIYQHETIYTTSGKYVDFSFTMPCSAKIFAENYYLTIRFRAEYSIIAAATYVKELEASFKVL